MTHTFGVGEYKTRDGRKAVVLHVLRGLRTYPLLGIIEDENGDESLSQWKNDGGYSNNGPTNLDLMPPPPPRVERWVGIPLGYYGAKCGHSTVREVMESWPADALAVPIKLTIEGEGPDARIVSAEVVDAP